MEWKTTGRNVRPSASNENPAYNMKIDKLDEVTILFGISDNNPGNCLLILKAKTTETRKLEFSIAKKQ